MFCQDRLAAANLKTKFKMSPGEKNKTKRSGAKIPKCQVDTTTLELRVEK